MINQHIYIFQLRIKPDVDSWWMVGWKYNAQIWRNHGTPEKIVRLSFYHLIFYSVVYFHYPVLFDLFDRYFVLFYYYLLYFLKLSFLIFSWKEYEFSYGLNEETEKNGVSFFDLEELSKYFLVLSCPV